MASNEAASRFHSFFASGSSHDGHFMPPLGGTGSCALSGHRPLPRSPSSTFSAVGLGFLPAIATPPPFHVLRSLCLFMFTVLRNSGSISLENSHIGKTSSVCE